MNYLSVCSGIEAASVAWHPLGWTPHAFSEIEKFPSEVLAHHYPDVPNHGDMTKFKEWPDASIDVLVGGTPCQSFSVAGLRKGLDDPRGNLMLTYLAIADKYRPRWLVWENVPGVLSSNGGRDFASFLRGLAELGYGFAYRVLDAQFFGVAQRRRRVFVVGCLGDWRRAAAVLFERHSLQGHPAPSRKAGKRITGPIAGCSNGGGANGPGRTADDADSLIETMVMSSGQANAEITVERSPTLNCDHEAPILVSHSLRGEGFDASEDGTGRGTPLVPIAIQGNVINRKPENGGNGVGADNSGVMYTLTKTDQHAIAFGWQNSSQQGASASASASHTPTLDKSKVPAIGGGSMQVRRLTPRECERLQGFPDDYTLIPIKKLQPVEGQPAVIKMAADGPRYKALGNSMAVPVMRWIGERIQRVSEI